MSETNKSSAREFAKTWILDANRTLEEAGYDFAEAYAESECSRLASHVRELESDVRRWKDAAAANRDEAMKQQDLKLEQKQIASRLASRVEELEKALQKMVNLYESSDHALHVDEFGNHQPGRCVICDAEIALAGAHAEEKE